jgi:LPS sulfotransferase NodH
MAAKNTSDRPSQDRADEATQTSRFSSTGASERIAKLNTGDESPPVRSTVAAETSPNPRLLFILSTERSGSTLLSLALGANERHVSPPEMHLLAYPTFDAWCEDYPSAMLSLRFLLRSCGDEASETEIRSRFSGWRSEDVYRWVLTNRLGDDKVFIDKTPKYGRDGNVLTRIETLAPRYIWLVRHPLGVASSQIELREARRAAKTAGLIDRLKQPLRALRARLNRRRMIEEEVAYWKAVHANIERFLAGVDPARWRRVSFERFVADPEAVLRELCAWLGSEFRQQMLEPGEHVPREMRPELGDPKIYRRQRIDASAAGAWKRHISEEILDAESRELIERWGVGR